MNSGLSELEWPMDSYSLWFLLSATMQSASSMLGKRQSSWRNVMRKATRRSNLPSARELAARREEERKAKVVREFQYEPNRMVPVRRSQRHDAKPGETDLRNVKVTISIRLDADIIEFFKAKAASPGSVPYQTQMNNALRSFMESETGNARAEHYQRLADKLEAEVSESKRILESDAMKYADVYTAKLNDAAVYRNMAERLRERGN
jgi:uncharacterized protein (DUF4415 family)